ncbi:MAG: hypothetical protein DWQ34_19665 [Planctomycetota bacterium]|nr:MAG: hypothetical protein DWQ34_19665 [Planctomycetota bacterium]
MRQALRCDLRWPIQPVLLLSLTLPGCGGNDNSPATRAADAAESVEETPQVAPREDADPMEAVDPAFAPIRLGDDPGANLPDSEQASEQSGDDPEAEERRSILAAMMPLQIMLGEWRGTTRNQIGDFNAVDQPRWVWDFQTDRDQPAMVMTSEGSPYIREARLTWLTDKDLYRLTLTDPDDKTRTFLGTFSQGPEDVQGDDKKLHRTYKLELTESDPEDEKDQWQIVLNQQENNRYLVELYERRGSSFRRFDTVSTQRQGTSIAASDEDYGTRTCVISGGLGTIQVSYQGKSYWVCCTGCKAAFEEDPATWIAEFEAKQADAE